MSEKNGHTQLAVAPPANMGSELGILKLGEVFAKSGYFADAKAESQAIVKILAGQEMGIAPLAAMTGIHIIEGKPSIGAGLMAAAIKRHPKYDYKVLHSDDESCEVEFYENGKPVGRTSYSVKEAVEKGIAKANDGKLKKNWRTFPQQMCFSRCISNGHRMYCPDVFGPLPAYSTEEMDDRDDSKGSKASPSEPTVTVTDAEPATDADLERYNAKRKQAADMGLTPTGALSLPCPLAKLQLRETQLDGMIAAVTQAVAKAAPAAAPGATTPPAATPPATPAPASKPANVDDDGVIEGDCSEPEPVSKAHSDVYLRAVAAGIKAPDGSPLRTMGNTSPEARDRYGMWLQGEIDRKPKPQPTVTHSAQISDALVPTLSVEVVGSQELRDFLAAVEEKGLPFQTLAHGSKFEEAVTEKSGQLCTAEGVTPAEFATYAAWVRAGELRW